MATHAEIIAIGDEITSGQMLDTNSQWLAQRLEALGVRTLYHTTVGDELQPCVNVFRHAMARANLVVVTGGLGPTADDLTRQSLGEATGRPLQLDAAALRHVRDIFTRLHRQMPPQNEIQAMFPAGSRVIPNPHGTAPGIDLEVPCSHGPAEGGCRFFCLPGVPAEMMEMWRESVAPVIAAMVGPDRRVVLRRTIHCFGAGESQIESMLPDMIRRGRQPTVGITASKATVTLRIAAEGASEAECVAAIEPTAAAIYDCLGSLVHSEGDDQLQDALVRLLRGVGRTLATADGATGGLLAEWLAGVNGSSDVYRGGLVLSRPDSPAEALAAECRTRFGTDFGLAVAPSPSIASDSTHTAVPGPSVTIALASDEAVAVKHVAFALHPELRHIYLAKQSLDFVRQTLLLARQS
ncbi:MAG: CinA family nicotinamide mononucleotide deamidase-related protein [Thermoguttaceae bacterium]